MRVLVTGAAGFIGSNVVKAVLDRFDQVSVLGIDNLDGYYDVRLKESRLEVLNCREGFSFVKGDIADKAFMESIFVEFRPEYVLHFAAKVGVRHSVLHPDEYISTNINGFYNILEACRKHPVSHLVYASSSSVYGANSKVPYSTDDRTDAPVSLYAATKKSNEMMAHAYSQLFGIPSTGLRFFTVYGPAGRPDMAYFKFTDAMVRREKMQIYNYGRCQRDFTYIDDIVEGIIHVMSRPPMSGYALYNIGGSRPEGLMEFIGILKEELVSAGVLPEDYDLAANMELMPMQPGDVAVTCADTSALERDFGFRPATPLREGLRAFARWYGEFYRNV